MSISVIGVGRLGLCFALVLSNAGYNVLGIDVSQKYVDSLNDKTYTSLEPRVNELLEMSKFTASTKLDDALAHSSTIFVSVATPNSGTEGNAYDHSHLSNVLIEINKRKVSDKHIIIVCTVQPGYIRDVGNYLLKDCKNCTLSYNPEFIAQGNIIYGLLNADMVLIGEGSKDAGDVLENIYKTISPSSSIQRMSPESAEICKLAVNCFITTKIAYANFIGDLASITPGADPTAILRAIGQDARIGSKCLSWGWSFGGPCFPRDNRALGFHANKVGLNAIMPEATDQANKEHIEFQLGCLLEDMKFKDEKNRKIMLSKVTYKDNCGPPIIEESAKLKYAEMAVRQGITVTICDREIVLDEVKKQYGGLFLYKSNQEQSNH